MTGKCKTCAFYQTPKCTHAEDHRKFVDGVPLMTEDDTCSDFFSAREKEGKQKKKQFKDSGACEDGYFEAIYHDGKPSFLVKTKEGFNICESLEIGDKTFYPKETKQIPYEPYGYYRGDVPNREELFWKVRDEFDLFIDVESIWKEDFSACVLLSYQQEKLQTVPYLFPYGDNESGKSTLLQLLKALCYRPLYGVTIPAADLYGYLEDSDSIGCIFEDEVQGIYKDIDKIKIYKAGYKQGAVVPRTIITQYDRIIKYYPTFCLKGCASEQIPQVKGFNERFHFIPMVEGYPKKEWADITLEDLKRLQNLRNILLKWRLLSKEWQLPDVQLSLKGRIKELWKPVLQITSGLSVYDTLFRFVTEQQNERLGSKQNTLEGHLVKVVVDLHNRAGEPVEYLPFQTVWTELSLDLDARIDDKKPNVMDTPEFFKVTKNKVGYRLREVLSGKSKAVREKRLGGDEVIKAYVFDFEKLRRVSKKYGYELVTKLPTLPSSESALPCENNGKTTISAPLELSNLSNLVTTKDLVSVYWKENSFSKKVCGVCGYEKETCWEAETNKHEVIAICEDCKDAFEKEREVKA